MPLGGYHPGMLRETIRQFLRTTFQMVYQPLKFGKYAGIPSVPERHCKDQPQFTGIPDVQQWADLGKQVLRRAHC